ncbi:DUF7311 family protein [Halorubrum trueperi]|uniref:DUF7311 domain-containing protein n=1 Tax=Halorubrum trueperi TaxID=2004704 RepID=A0ABD5UI36_9EURY
MIRVVLTVAVAVALLAASMPVLEAARTDTTVQRLDTQAERIERAAAGVVAGSAAVSDPSLAARTTATVRSPSGITAAPVDRLALVESDRGEPTATVALRYRIDGGPERTVPVVPETVPANVEIESGPIELRTRGDSRIEFLFVNDGEPTIRIARLG